MMDRFFFDTAADAPHWAATLTSGKALQSAPLRTLFCLGAEEEALCFVNIGTIACARLLRERPLQNSYVSTLAPLRAGTP